MSFLLGNTIIERRGLLTLFLTCTLGNKTKLHSTASMYSDRAFSGTVKHESYSRFWCLKMSFQ